MEVRRLDTATNFVRKEEHPLLCFFDEGADVHLQLEVTGHEGSQEAEGLHSVYWGVTQGDWGWVLPVVNNHLHCLKSIELQVVLAASGHQMVFVPPVGGLIPIRDESNEGGGVVRELQELDRLMTGSAGVGIQGEEKRGKNTALSGTRADGPGVGDVFPLSHVLTHCCKPCIQ